MGENAANGAGESVSPNALNATVAPTQLSRAAVSPADPSKADEAVEAPPIHPETLLVERAQRSPDPVLSQTLPLSVEELLEAMSSRYTDAAQYEDAGQVTERRGKSVSTAHFTTQWNREAGELTFTYRMPDRSYTIKHSSSGETTIIDSAASEPQPRKSLELALRVARRMTKGTTEIILPLLLPSELSETGFWQATTNFSRGESKAVDGVRCHVLRGDYYDADGVIELWIDHQNNLRQIRIVENRLARTTTWNFVPKTGPR